MSHSRRAQAEDVGLPCSRPRVLWFLFRRDLYTAEDVEAAMASFQLIKAKAPPVKSLAEVLSMAGGGDDGAPGRLAKLRFCPMSSEALLECGQYRSAHGLPSRDAVGGRPFTVALPRDSRWRRVEREGELLDIAHLLAAQQGHSPQAAPPSFCSQQFGAARVSACQPSPFCSQDSEGQVLFCASRAGGAPPVGT